MPITKEFELVRSSCAFVVELLHHLCATVVHISQLHKHGKLKK